ncbi:MAG: hypothetical protein CMG71_06400 [Candidatus Marinimicrobia bacterium]|nr:hypothetical protein [Candidatus Neomarinimicrobiota bacterium]|tara:strand:- start:1221 stop:2666 length:1446 start_codon:yes stop_codon:yes gene_type:complete
MKRRTSLQLIAVILLIPLSAKDTNGHPSISEAVQLIEVWLDAQRDYEGLPGLSAAVVHDQKTMWSGGFGYSNPDKKRKTDSKTIHSICSISKLFTAIAIMQLRDEGKIRLDDPVSNHLPWFNIENNYPNRGEATVQNILTHSSGLPRESDYPYWSPPDFPFPSRDAIKGKVSDQNTLYPANTYFQYSNLGLTLAGEIVAEVSGFDFDSYIEKNIFRPLGMMNTRTEMPEKLYGNQLAVGHAARNREGDRPKVELFHAEGIGPAAGFSSTADDLAKFASWQFRLLGDDGHEVLKSNTLREMHRVHFLDDDWQPAWGLGFSIWRNGEKKFVGHGGSCPGYRSQLLIQPKSKIATVFMTNASSVNSRKFAQELYNIFAPAVESANSGDDAQVINQDFKDYLGHYSEAPWGGETAVISWKGELSMLPLPTKSPVDAVARLQHMEDDVFRRIRDDDELGEEIRFERDKTGKVVRMWQHQNFAPRIR